jgi:hypothetical protein
MKNIKGHCLCGKVNVLLHEYGNFIYVCHCDSCRRQGAGPTHAIDPGNGQNVDFISGENSILRYQSSEHVERGFCKNCGTFLFWHNDEGHYRMNAELFDAIIADGSFELELFYDEKPAYYDFKNATKKLDSKFETVVLD